MMNNDPDNWQLIVDLAAPSQTNPITVLFTMMMGAMITHVRTTCSCQLNGPVC